MKAHTVDAAEIAHFAKDSADWWNPEGPFKPLHWLTPARMKYLRATIGFHYGIADDAIEPFKGLSVVDIGCGGGLACEPMARLGASVTGVDADANAIKVAKAHAAEQDLHINYITGAAEDLTDKKKTFDIVLALEVIEHVSDPAVFMSLCSKLLKPGGILIVSTLNRTWKSYALGIIAAEYILNWAPKGTHDWKKFIRPAEAARLACQQGLTVVDVCGLAFDPVARDFALRQHDVEINYFLAAKK